MILYCILPLILIYITYIFIYYIIFDLNLFRIRFFYFQVYIKGIKKK